MNGRWSPERKAFLVRDLVRDYCQVYEGLEEQRRRFDHEGAVSYSSIRDLLGEAMRKGVFWLVAVPDLGMVGLPKAELHAAVLTAPHVHAGPVVRGIGEIVQTTLVFHAFFLAGPLPAAL